MAAAEERLKIFVSYSHEDVAWLKRVQVHLTPFVRDKRVELWDDTRMRAGDLWRKEITEALSCARVAILLISADFYASGFIAQNEVLPLLKAERERGLVIIGIHINFFRLRPRPGSI